MQQELKLGPMQMAELKFLPMSDIRLCHSERDAVLLCWHRRTVRMTVEDAAEQIGVSKGTLSKYLNGQIEIGVTRRHALQWVCKNRAISQYAAYAEGCSLVPREPTEDELKDAEIERLRAELDQAKTRRAVA